MNNYIISAIILLFTVGMIGFANYAGFSSKTTLMQEPAETNNIPEAKLLKINIDRSEIGWKGTKRLFTAGHEGTVQLKDGFLLFKDGNLVGGKITADMNTIAITKSLESEKDKVFLSNYLKTKEFNAQKYPTASFKISRVKYLGGDSLRVWGNMSIKDISKNVSVPAFIDYPGKNQKRFRTRFSLKRSDWNIGVDGNLLERNLVDDNFELRIALETEK